MDDQLLSSDDEKNRGGSMEFKDKQGSEKNQKEINRHRKAAKYSINFIDNSKLMVPKEMVKK